MDTSYFNRFTVAKPTKIKKFDYTTEDTIKPDSEMFSIEFDKNYFNGLLDQIHKQKTLLEKEGYKAKFIKMSRKTYEQILVYNFNISGNIDRENVGGLIPIVWQDFEDYEIRVLCSAYDEMLFVEELSKLRYGDDKSDNT